MIFMGSKRVIFSTSFLARYSETLIVQASLEYGKLANFRFTFTDGRDNPGVTVGPAVDLSEGSDPMFDVQVRYTPSAGATEDPLLVFRAPDGAEMSMQLTLQPFGSSTLVNFFVLKTGNTQHF